MKKIVRLWLALLIPLFFVACTASPDFPTEKRVEKIYMLYLDGKYEKYVEHIQSCKDKPEDYKERIAELHRHHAREMKAKGVETTGLKVTKMVRRPGAEVVDVFLRINYADGSAEEKLFPMVFDEGKWWAW